jgi:hypothetical protein
VTCSGAGSVSIRMAREGPDVRWTRGSVGERRHAEQPVE